MRSHGDGLEVIRAMCARIRAERIEAELEELKKFRDDARLAAARYLENNQPLTRAEVAAFLRVSEKKIQRMDTAGKIARCADMGGSVLYPARDVLRLASASSRKGA